MVRLIVHRHEPPDEAPDRAAQLVGGLVFLACIAAILVAPNPHLAMNDARPHELSVLEALVPLFVESAPLLLTVLVASELVIAASRRCPSHGGVTWLPSTVLYAVLLGPWFAVVIGVVTPALAWTAHRPRSARLEWLRFCIPRGREVLPSYVVGVALAAAAEAALPAGALRGWDVASVVVAALLGSFLPIGAGAPLVAAIAWHKGASLAAVLAFALGVIASAQMRTSTARLACAAVACALGIAVAAAIPGEQPSLHELGRHDHAVIEWMAAASLAGWIVVDLARIGPRAWLRSG